jgi:hypothetical protein
MDNESSEIVVLKPTKVFSLFLSSQLPVAKIPHLSLLQTDNTAYVIKKKKSETETLNEIEKKFPLMFRHEISRWLGEGARNAIEDNFLDFLCCFKLEFHSHLILMEPLLKDGKQVLKIQPRLALFNWIRELVEEQEELALVMEQIKLSHLTENATILVKNFSKLMDIKPFLQNYYKPIFNTAMSRISGQNKNWPHVDSFSSFSTYFSIEIHTQLIHLSS